MCSSRAGGSASTASTRKAGSALPTSSPACSALAATSKPSAGTVAGQPAEVVPVVRVDGRPIGDFDDLNGYLVFHTRVGQTIQITVLRDGQRVTVPLKLGARP